MCETHFPLAVHAHSSKDVRGGFQRSMDQYLSSHHNTVFSVHSSSTQSETVWWQDVSRSLHVLASSQTRYSGTSQRGPSSDKGTVYYILSTMDKTKSPNFIPTINIMRLEPLKEDNLYTGEST